MAGLGRRLRMIGGTLLLSSAADAARALGGPQHHLWDWQPNGERNGPECTQAAIRSPSASSTSSSRIEDSVSRVSLSSSIPRSSSASSA